MTRIKPARFHQASMVFSVPALIGLITYPLSWISVALALVGGLLMMVGMIVQVRQTDYE